MCLVFAFNSRFMRLFRPLLTTVSTAPFFAILSIHGLSSRFTAGNFTVHTEMITIKIPDRLKNVIVSVIFAKWNPLGIPRCNCSPRVLPRNCYISRESIRLGIKKCNCNWESAKVSHKRVFALLTPEIHSYAMAQMLQKKTSVHAPGLSADECEHAFVWYFGAGWCNCNHQKINSRKQK